MLHITLSCRVLMKQVTMNEISEFQFFLTAVQNYRSQSFEAGRSRATCQGALYHWAAAFPLALF
jgi:hypothetical protein